MAAVPYVPEIMLNIQMLNLLQVFCVVFFFLIYLLLFLFLNEVMFLRGQLLPLKFFSCCYTHLFLCQRSLLLLLPVVTGCLE